MARLRVLTNIDRTFMAFFKQFIRGSESRPPKLNHLVQIPAAGQQHWAKHLTAPCLSFQVRKNVFLHYRVTVRIKLVNPHNALKTGFVYSKCSGNISFYYLS